MRHRERHRDGLGRVWEGFGAVGGEREVMEKRMPLLQKTESEYRSLDTERGSKVCKIGRKVL